MAQFVPLLPGSVFDEAGYAVTIEAAAGQVRQLYLADDVPWVLGHSGGKDSVGPPLAAPCGKPAVTGPGAHQAGLVLIGCGARKTARPARAADLYAGSYFRACLLAALAIAPRSRVLVLSARHGLLGLDDGPIAPYELTLGQPGSVIADQVRAQAAARGIAHAPVVALCGARYAAFAAHVWAQVATPLAGLGIGHQRHVLAVLRGGGCGQDGPAPGWVGEGGTGGR